MPGPQATQTSSAPPPLPTGYALDSTMAGPPPLPSGYELDKPAPPSKTEKAIVPAMGGGFIAVDVPAGEGAKYEAAHKAGYAQGGKAGLTALGAAVGPELLPEMEGSGLLGYLGRVLFRSAAAGAGAGAGNVAGQVATGENPISKENLKETGRVALTTGALSLPLEAIGQIPFTKMGRAAVNQSLGAQTRDVTYGNPAQALLKEEITDIPTGDYEAYKTALRSGKSPAEAAQAAGGRFAAVNQRINELTPRLNAALSRSQAIIPVKDVIDKPLDSAALDIIMNPAMTATEKDAAINQLGALQKALKTGLGQTATPSQFQVIKLAIGNRVNWGGTISVTDEVKPAYRAVYASIKNAINQAVPEAAPINERLTNLLAAHSDLDTLARAEEVGRGVGLARGKIGSSVAGALESGAGRVLPAATKLPRLRAPIGAAAGLSGSLSDMLSQ